MSSEPTVPIAPPDRPLATPQTPVFGAPDVSPTRVLAAIAAVALICIAPSVFAEEAEDNSFDIDLPVPAGQPVRGIRVPYYGADGTTLQMVLEAEVARRVDDANIEMDNMKIDAISDDGSKILVEMPQSVFNMETRMLSGEKGVLIKREDFEITGREGEFDIKNRFGRVLGNVKMIINDMEILE